MDQVTARCRYEAIGAGERDGFTGALVLGSVGQEAEGAIKGHTAGGWSHAVQAMTASVPIFFASRNAYIRAI